MKKYHIISAIYSLAITYMVGKWAINVAYMERGYEAVGSEYMLILITYVVAWRSCNKLFEKLGERKSGSNKGKC